MTADLWAPVYVDSSLPPGFPLAQCQSSGPWVGEDSSETAVLFGLRFVHCKSRGTAQKPWKTHSPFSLTAQGVKLS